MSYTFALTEDIVFMDGFADFFSLIDDQRKEKEELESTKAKELRDLEERYKREMEEERDRIEHERRKLLEKQQKARQQFEKSFAT